MILIDSENKMYIVELTVGHESNVDRNIKRKADKYSHLLKDQRLLRTYKKVELINLVITTGGVFSKDTKPFFYDAELIRSRQSHYGLHKTIILHILQERERLDDTRAYGILTMHRSND